MDWAGALRDALRERAAEWSAANGVPRYSSLGRTPTILFEPSADGLTHGNFHADSWRDIQADPGWRSRLEKPHSQVAALPAAKAGVAKELDSSNSSDALLMNCFCFPGAANQILVALGIHESHLGPEFGFKARLPLADGAQDATEIDMRIGSTLFEAKLTEKNFTVCQYTHVLRYRDFVTYIDPDALRAQGGEIVGYQLIRNVLAAAHHNANLVVLIDQRRPDLLQEWWQVHSAIRATDLRLRCSFRTWQQVAAASPSPLRHFLQQKYCL